MRVGAGRRGKCTDMGNINLKKANIKRRKVAYCTVADPGSGLPDPDLTPKRNRLRPERCVEE